VGATPWRFESSHPQVFQQQALKPVSAGFFVAQIEAPKPPGMHKVITRNGPNLSRLHGGVLSIADNPELGPWPGCLEFVTSPSVDVGFFAGWVVRRRVVRAQRTWSRRSGRVILMTRSCVGCHLAYHGLVCSVVAAVPVQTGPGDRGGA
jgi:hypothetical protein